jgi:hypothetical protein
MTSPVSALFREQVAVPAVSRLTPLTREIASSTRLVALGDSLGCAVAPATLTLVWNSRSGDVVDERERGPWPLAHHHPIEMMLIDAVHANIRLVGADPRAGDEQEPESVATSPRTRKGSICRPKI